uniref:PX domain-containing protein n=1 Tax=Panagrolaimus sp. JU765 TaxID=591449 RepID=A0AC34R050_9BILA
MSAATQRLVTKKQTLDEAYAPPANFLEIEVVNPITHGVGKNRYTDYEIRLPYAPPANFLEIEVVNPITHGVGKNRYTDYEIRLRTNLPVFKHKESSVRRRYSDFEWLRTELERDSKIIVPPLPGKALKRQLPFRNDDGIFEEAFIEDRRKGLEIFLNKVSGHPLAQSEKSLHIFLQSNEIDKNYVPGRIRTV